VNSNFLFNPQKADFSAFDAESRRIFLATIAFFEQRGKRVLLEQDRERIWYADFIDFLKRERVLATLLTPAAEAGGDPNKRWDTRRILGFYGGGYWYAWQVTILGLGPIWQSGNAALKQRAANLLDAGAVFALGLSEREHGADIYTTDMVLTADGQGGYKANGGKYYIGNGNVARMVSVFGRIAGIEGPDAYVFFTADSQHPTYKLRGNVVATQMYVAAFDLEDYPVTAVDILHTGQAAFDAGMNTVNVGKFNLGFGAEGLVEHCFYEAITHAERRILFNAKVTDFAHVQALFTDAYSRLAGMKLFGERAIDYMHCASPEDRRYLLFNTVEKITVTRQGAKAYADLWDVISAKGFEKDMFFQMAQFGLQGFPKIEGTVHVNLALALKFMPSYLFSAADAGLATAPMRRDAADDEYLFRQGPTKGLAKVRFHDWRPVFARFAHVPNVAVLTEQIEALQVLLATAAPTSAQQKDLDFVLAIGEMFTLVPYAELILQQAEIEGTDQALLDQIFDVLVRDFSGFALALYGKPSATDAQQSLAMKCIRRPKADAERFETVWRGAQSLAGAYEMNP
jgi:acyl-CoA dehydrogenase